MPVAPSLQISLFELLRDEFGASLAPIRCSKATLVHLSHTIEDTVLQQHIPALLFTGFQQSSHWRRETERYRALAEVAQQVCIFAGGTLPPESSARQLHVTLSGDDPLRQEWFLVVLSAEFSVVLCGQDQQVPANEEALRQFDTLWSFEPSVVNRVLDMMERVVAEYRPERLAPLQQARRQYPASVPDARLITHFSAEMIRFEEELHHRMRATANELAKQMRWRDDMQAMLMHDMRTPLQTITSVLDLLMMDGVTPQQEELLSFARRGAAQLVDLAQILVDVGRLEAGQLQLQWQAFRPDLLITDAVHALHVQSESAGVALTSEIDSTIAMLWADAMLLRRVIQNLVSNAIKFTDPNGHVMVSLVHAPRAPAVELQVRDTGKGIAPDLLPHIFQRFFQADVNDRRGSGLGLYFCRLVAEAHGGSIRAESQIGVGTSFVLTLPNKPML